MHLDRDLLPCPTEQAAQLQAEAVRTSVPLSQAELDAYLGGAPTLTERLVALHLRARGSLQRVPS